MAISNTRTKNEYTLDALTTTFPITFDVVKDDNGDAKDLLVSLVENGETTVLVRNTDYTVSDLDVTYADAVNHAGATLIVARNTPRTQETDFVNNGSYNLQQIEDMSDKLTRIAQEQDTDISDKIVLAESLAEAAQESADNAYASEDKAHDWADKAPDVEVETGEYSAKHWASKASQSSGSAAVSAYDASVYAGQASSARGQSASYALVSEGYANGEQSGTPVGSDSPYYQNNSKYWSDVAKQYATGGLFYVGVWTITSQTDYSAISTPRKKGDLFYCQGTSTTIDGVTYTSGDFIVFNQDVTDGTTITTSMIDKIDNTETVTPDNTCTLENKTIDSADNTIIIDKSEATVTCSPTTITADTTITPTSEMNVVIDTAYVCVTLASSAPYVGYRLPILVTASYGFVKFNSSCVCLSKTSAVFIWNGTSWNVESGATFHMDNTVYSHIPTGTKPSDWKEYIGTGTYHFCYAFDINTSYDLPDANSNISVTWRYEEVASAIAAGSYIGTGEGNVATWLWTRRFYLNWSTAWAKVKGSQSNGAVHTETNLLNGFTGTITWCVLNGLCYVTAWGLQHPSSTSQLVALNNIPKSKMYCTAESGDLFMYTFNDGNLTCLVKATGQPFYGTLTYPVADDWVES